MTGPLPLEPAAFDAWLGQGARILVVAPHPDDESLAAGGLLARAAARGASVCVLLLTNGDNNPWPQRFVERRWRIDAAARARWGARRRAESAAALAALGVDGGALVPFDWPDLGLTERLMAHTDESVARIHRAIAEFAPQLMIRPALDDLHPDHGAAHVLSELALGAFTNRPQTLDYRIHSRAHDGRMFRFALGDAELAAKRRAVLAYASQTSLSRGRLLARVRDVEEFLLESPRAPPVLSKLPWNEFLIVEGTRSTRLPRLSPAHLDEIASAARAAASPLFIKPASRIRSPWIFDRWGWQRVA